MKVSLEVVNFEEAMRGIEEEVKQIAEEEVGLRVAFATTSLRRVTPVDTGEARSGWTSRPELDFRGETSYVIENPVEHITYLNRGSSKQAPKYFIEQVLTTIGLIGSPI